MTCFVKPNQTAINRIVYYSILQRDLRVTLLQLRKAMIMLRGLAFTIPSFNDLRAVELELISRSEEVQNNCKLLLLPILGNIDFGHKYLNHWAISMNDIKNGYCELEEIIQYKHGRPLIFGRKYILLLYDYQDSTLGKFYGGEIIELAKAIHFIDNIPPQKDKVKGLYDAILNSIELAMRYRTSNTLSHD
jgi:hypothetical protein